MCAWSELSHFTLTTTLGDKYHLTSLSNRGNWGTEQLSNLAKVIQRVSRRVKLKFWSTWYSLCSQSLHPTYFIPLPVTAYITMMRSVRGCKPLFLRHFYWDSAKMAPPQSLIMAWILLATLAHFPTGLESALQSLTQYQVDHTGSASHKPHPLLKQSPQQAFIMFPSATLPCSTEGKIPPWAMASLCAVLAPH